MSVSSSQTSSQNSPLLDSYSSTNDDLAHTHPGPNSRSSSVSGSTPDLSSAHSSSGPSPESSIFTPTQAPLSHAEVNPSASSKTEPDNQPSLDSAQKSREKMESMVKSYKEAKARGLETAAADIIYRIVILAGELAIFGASLALATVTCGAATPLAVWAGLGVAVSAADLGFSVGNVALRAAGKDGFTYHGDSISNILEAILRKGGMTDEAKIDKITNYVSSGIRMGLGSFTLCGNQLHRPGFIKEGSGPSCREYMDYRLPRFQSDFAKKILKEREEANRELNLTTEELGEVPATPPTPENSETEPAPLTSAGGNPPPPPAPPSSGEPYSSGTNDDSEPATGMHPDESANQGQRPKGPQPEMQGSSQTQMNQSSLTLSAKDKRNANTIEKVQNLKAKLKSLGDLGSSSSVSNGQVHETEQEEISEELKANARAAIEEGISKMAEDASKNHPISCREQANHEITAAHRSGISGHTLGVV